MRSVLLFLLASTLLPGQVPEEFALPENALAREDGPRDWRFQVGAMVLALPKAPGSEEGRVLPWPVLSAQYQDWLVLGASRIGLGAGATVRLVRHRAFGWDVGLGVGERRREERADELAGMGDRDSSLWAGTAVRARAGSFGASLSWAAGLGQGAGTRATLSVGVGGRLQPRWHGSMALSSSWADARQMAFEFGVDPEQAATRAGLISAGDPRLRAGEDRPFQPRAGLRDSAATFTLSYAADLRWRIFGLARIERLGDQPAASPLVRKPSQGLLGAGFSCRL